MNPEATAEERPIEVLKLRAAEYEKRYEGMRELEWKVLLQVYTGYAAIAALYRYLSDPSKHGSCAGHPELLGSSFLAGILLFYVLSVYLTYRIQERLIVFDHIRERYLIAIHREVGVAPLGGTERLRGKYYWTYRTQSILSVTTMLGLLFFVAHISWPYGTHASLWTQSFAPAGAITLILGLSVPWLKIARVQEMVQTVWYVSYGSNLKAERFMCYIQGGTPEYSTAINPGCRDRTPPMASRACKIPAKLYFAKTAKTWQDRGVAFVSLDKNAVTLGRMYLLTYEQFIDVVLQENGMKPGTKSILPKLKDLHSQSESFLKAKGEESWYGRVLCLGEWNSDPLFTFTAKTHLVGELNAPSKEYLSAISVGLKQTYPKMSVDAIADYLAKAEGVSGSVASDSILEWVKASIEEDAVRSRLDFS
jgi:hypothetical protein